MTKRRKRKMFILLLMVQLYMNQNATFAIIVNVKRAQHGTVNCWRTKTMIDFKVTFYMHDGSREIYNNLAHIEFYNEFVLIQDWNGATLTIDNNKFDRFDVIQYYDI